MNRSRPGIEDTDKQEMVEVNVEENTHTLPESAGRTQKPTETKPDESMITIKNDNYTEEVGNSQIPGND